jgi:putative membrane protein
MEALMAVSHRNYLLILAGLFSLLWVVLAIKPHYRADWLVENLLVAAFIILVSVFHRKLLLSRISYTLIFLFLCLHEVGAHYTYAEVPYDRWFQSIFGVSLNGLAGWERNNFDRLVHFSYGLLLAYPVREVFLRVANVKGFWGYFLPLDLTMSTSMMFELFEWAAVAVFGGDLGVAYLGTQGDIWDAHKDMALASLGALIAMIIIGLLNLSLQRILPANGQTASGETSRTFGRRRTGAIAEEEDLIGRMPYIHIDKLSALNWSRPLWLSYSRVHYVGKAQAIGPPGHGNTSLHVADERFFSHCGCL